MALSGAGGVALRRRHLADDLLQDLDDSDPLLRRGGHRLRGVEADDLLDLAPHALHVGAGQVDLVDDRDDLQVVVEGLVDVGQGLRLHPLGGVHHQDGTLAGGERARDLVGEVHVAGGVDEVELVLLAVLGPVGHADGLRLDGDPALALQLHVVEELGLRVPFTHRAGGLEQPVGQRRLPVVDVGDDREVADVLVGFGHRRRAFSTARSPVRRCRAEVTGITSACGWPYATPPYVGVQGLTTGERRLTLFPDFPLSRAGEKSPEETRSGTLRG